LEQENLEKEYFDQESIEWRADEARTRNLKATDREAATDKLGADALEDFSEERDKRDYEFSLKPPGPSIS